MLGIGHLEVRLPAREEHAENLLEVLVHLAEGGEERRAHLAVDRRGNLGEGSASALEIGELLRDIVRTRAQALVLLHSHLVHRAEVIDLPDEARELALRRLTVLGLRKGERFLEHGGAVGGDSGDRALHLDLELSALDVDLVLRGNRRIHLLLGRSDLLLGVFNGLLERGGISLLERSLVTQTSSPFHSALKKGGVAVMQRIDAQAEHFERPRGLRRRTNAAVKPLKATL